MNGHTSPLAFQALQLVPSCESTATGINLINELGALAFAKSHKEANHCFHVVRSAFAAYCINVFGITDREDPTLRQDSDLSRLASMLDLDSPLAGVVGA
tara:strand:+ start:495 stop:791 length:297 start_codon:yes stop_codon:yes gene_type:complete